VVYIWFDKAARKFARFQLGNAITPEPADETAGAD
jgi:hypothetical protein